ncbi:MAG: hypothetical protein IJ409_01880 [Lachnospiraceae bacterium]|nr:hypothetical protein [Lachnospiraceae bacterium]
MGLDIYAGTFTRYYARNWKTKTQQFCEEHGIEYSLTTAYEVPEDLDSLTQQIEEDVNAWMQQLVSVLSDSGIEKAAVWPENNIKDYYTDKPDWDALGALLLIASAKALKEDFPAESPKGMDYFRHEFVEKASEKVFTGWALFAGVFHYIPIEDSFYFQYPLLNGVAASIGTVAGLKQELQAINKLCWNAPEETVWEWIYTEGYPSDGYVDVDGNYKMQEVHNTYNTESLAKFAFAVLWQAVRFAEEEKVVIIFDY